MTAAKKIKTEPFLNTISNGIHTITLPKIIDDTQEKELESHIKTWLLKEEKIHIIDFNNSNTIPHFVFRLLGLFQKSLMKVDKNLASINVAKEVQKELLARGLGAAFKPLKNIEEAREKFKETHAKQTSVHMEIIEPFITATMNTLETQVSMKVKKEKPYLIGAGPDLQIDIAGLVNLVSPQFTGAVAVCFPKDTFLGMSPLN